jgi:hypothetical protein
VTYNHANWQYSGTRKSENFLRHPMQMCIKRYYMKLEVRNSNTTLHTSKTQMHCHKNIKCCIIIIGHNKYTHISQDEINIYMKLDSHGTYLLLSPLRINIRVLVNALWAQIIGRYVYIGAKHGLITLHEKSNARREWRKANKTTYKCSNVQEQATKGNLQSQKLY